MLIDLKEDCTDWYILVKRRNHVSSIKVVRIRCRFIGFWSTQVSSRNIFLSQLTKGKLQLLVCAGERKEEIMLALAV